jgi:hypothetical protein
MENMQKIFFFKDVESFSLFKTTYPTLLLFQFQYQPTLMYSSIVCVCASCCTPPLSPATGQILIEAAVVFTLWGKDSNKTQINTKSAGYSMKNTRARSNSRSCGEKLN